MSRRPSQDHASGHGLACPLHRHDAAGIAAGGDEAEVGAGLRERVRIDVGLFGGILDGAHLLGAMGERFPEEPLGAPRGSFRLTGIA